jgi:hypothetical protein
MPLVFKMLKNPIFRTKAARGDKKRDLRAKANSKTAPAGSFGFGTSTPSPTWWCSVVEHRGGRTGWSLIQRLAPAPGVTGGQPHVYVATTILLAEFVHMKKGQQVAGVVAKGRFGLVDFLPKILKWI